MSKFNVGERVRDTSAWDFGAGEIISVERVTGQDRFKIHFDRMGVSFAWPDELKPESVVAFHPAAVERVARVLAWLKPGEPWPSNEDLGGGLTETLDNEFKADMFRHAGEVIKAYLEVNEEGNV